MNQLLVKSNDFKESDMTGDYKKAICKVIGHKWLYKMHAIRECKRCGIKQYHTLYGWKKCFTTDE